jgi:tRNA pseudouridine38-40 synthase
MWKYSVLLSYVGTRFCGWQKQLGTSANQRPSIQATVEEALLKMTGESVSVVGSGRTDAGVHALGQVAHFVLKSKNWDARVLHRGLNGLLRSKIQVVEVHSVPLEFHAQRTALKKQYSYYFQQGGCALPFLEPYTWWIQKPLNLKSMAEALQSLQGTHDFKAFRASGAQPGSTIRSLLELEVSCLPINQGCGIHSSFFCSSSEPGHSSTVMSYPFFLVRMRVVGTGFLKQMVRGIAGTLLQIGEGRRSPLAFQEILAQSDRSLVGPTAPARALWLEQVWYPDHIFNWNERNPFSKEIVR